MRKIKLDSIDIAGTTINELTVFIDAEGNVIPLPLLWVIHLCIAGLDYKWKTIGEGKRGINRRSYGITANVRNEFVETYISEKTIKDYIDNVFMYFKYLEESSDRKKTPGPNNTEIASQGSINHYINYVLPNRLDSLSSIKTHKSALMCYFNFLYFLNIRECTEILITKDTMQLISENRIKLRHISYICRKDRAQLLRLCKSKRDRIIIRLGYEVGLRTKEIRGLLLNDFKANNTRHYGLLSLFNELDKNIDKNLFTYTLNGKFTKGNKTRTIYFDRDLLAAFRDYYETERKEILKISGKKCDTLLVRSDYEGMGESVGKSQASNTFRKLKLQINHLSNTYRYHDLRHTFATELYHAEFPINNQIHGDNSAALWEVAQRLGHASIDSSRIYVKMRAAMLSMEELFA